MKKLVVTMAYGQEYKNIANMTLDSIKKYAKKYGADFIITDPWDKFKNNVSKMKLYSHLKKYDRVLFIDVDCIVHDSAENVFELVPEGKAGICEYRLIDNYLEKNFRIDRIKNELIPDLDFSEFKMFNCGFYTLDSCHLPLLEKFSHEEIHNTAHTDDEVIISELILSEKIEYVELSNLCHLYVNTFSDFLDLIPLNLLDLKSLINILSVTYDENRIHEYNLKYKDCGIVHLVLNPKNNNYLEILKAIQNKQDIKPQIKKWCSNIKSNLIKESRKERGVI